MNTEHENAAALLGVWALNACSAEESEIVMDHISRCRVCADESLRLGAAAESLDRRSGRAGPPRPLRARVLDRALARRAPSPAVPGYAAPYAAQVSVLEALLAELVGRDWNVTAVAEHDWSVQDLVAHLAATDGLLAARLGLPAGSADRSPPGCGDDVDSRTAAMVAHHRGRPAALTRAAWRDQAADLCARLGADVDTEAARNRGAAGGTADGTEAALAEQVIEMAWPLPVRAAVLSRAFETWIHTHDIASATGRALPAPLPEHLHPMADLGVTMLPEALAMHDRSRPTGTVRIVLTGSGGGDWLVPLSSAAERTPPGTARPEATRPEAARPGTARAEVPVAVIELDVLEFCFLAGGRREPREVSVGISGDEEIARDVLASVPAFSGP